jgi:peroxiredoxin
MRKRTEEEAMITRRNLFPLALAPLVPSLARGAEIPRPAGELSINTLSGGKMALSSYKGKVVVVEFLLTWCEHCQNAGRNLQKIYEELKGRDVQIIGVAVNTDAPKAGADLGTFMAASGVQFPLGWVPQNISAAFLQHPMARPMYFPQIALIDRKGMLRFHEGGNAGAVHDAATLRTQILKLLDEKS